MKKLFFLSILFLMVACTNRNVGEKRIMVTIEPQRYFVERIVDTLFTVESLVPSGLSPETYDAAPAQMMRLADAEVCFYIGGLGFENAWIENLKANNPRVKFFCNSESLNLIDADCDEEEHEHAHHHHHSGKDPHVWTSPRNALLIAENICESLSKVAPEYKEIFYNNLQKFSAEIRETDAEISALLQNSLQKAFIIFHPSLTYFARDYGLEQYVIETDGKEPSPEQLARIIDAARRKNIRTVFIQQEFDVRNAEIIARETACRLVSINPLSYNWREEMLRIARTLAE
jgi:zinc transport system substrate-binding protein